MKRFGKNLFDVHRPPLYQKKERILFYDTFLDGHSYMAFGLSFVKIKNDKNLYLKLGRWASFKPSIIVKFGLLISLGSVYNLCC